MTEDHQAHVNSSVAWNPTYKIRETTKTIVKYWKQSWNIEDCIEIVLIEGLCESGKR